MSTTTRKSKSVLETTIGSALALALFVVVLAILFRRSFLSEYIVFFNDAPLSIQNSDWTHLPQGFLGEWYDLNSVGVSAGAAAPSPVTLMKWFISPLYCTKFMIPLSLWFLGFSAWFFFRRSGMGQIPSTLGGLAACLVTAFFSNACWGSVPPIAAFAVDFLALAALAKRDKKLPFWLMPALAGFAVGLNVMEAADIGALFSLVIAAFVVCQSLADDGAPFSARAVRGIGRTILVAVFAGFIAAYSVSALITNNISGIAGTQQDEETKAAHWDYATEWSLPKHETLALFIPNVFGCSIITPGAANYWGGIGTDPSFERYFESGKQGPLPHGFPRHTGRGIYIGTFVVFIAFWAVLQSFRKRDSVFSPTERKLVWFWLAAACVALLLAYGRHSPLNLYRLVYALPYFSTIRNPDKFLHIVTFATVILFAYGLHGLYQRYLGVPLSDGKGGRLKTWWISASAFDKRWVIGSFAAILLSIVGWYSYASLRGHVENHLVEFAQVQTIAQGKAFDADSARGAHDFAASQVSLSLHQVGWFVLTLVAGSALLLLIFTGIFAGRRALWAGLLACAILTGDLVRADLPYIVFWNYKSKYEIDGLEPILKILATKPYEHRVGYVLPAPLSTPDDFASFKELYDIEWTQQLFPYYNVQTVDIVQMRSMPEDLLNFNNTLQVGIKQDGQGHYMLDDKTFYRLGRFWQLTSTRYLVGPAPLFGALNQQFDTAPNHFRIVQRFELGPRPGVTSAVQYSDLQGIPTEDPNARYALFEFTNALPRATLFSNWQVNTNSSSTLQQLASASFDPAKTVLLEKPLPGVANPSTNNQPSAAASISNYKPADIQIDAAPTTPSILMLSDRFDAGWQVWVDGKRSEVLRCDYLMRGVYLEPGSHKVEFLFRPNVEMLYVNVAAIFVGACLLGYAIVATRKQPSAKENDANSR